MKNTKKHDVLFQRAVDAAKELHSDTSVSIRKTRDSLCSLRGEIGMLIAAVEADLKREHK